MICILSAVQGRAFGQDQHHGQGAGFAAAKVRSDVSYRRAWECWRLVDMRWRQSVATGSVFSCGHVFCPRRFTPFACRHLKLVDAFFDKRGGSLMFPVKQVLVPLRVLLLLLQCVASLASPPSL